MGIQYQWPIKLFMYEKLVCLQSNWYKTVVPDLGGPIIKQEGINQGILNLLYEENYFAKGLVYSWEVEILNFNFKNMIH